MNIGTSLKTAALLGASLTLLACAGAPKQSTPTSSRPATGSSQGTPPPTSSSAPATRPPTIGARRPGGYYQDDGPDANPPPDLENIADATPKLEPLATRANRPYSVFGVQYIPLTQLKPYREKGRASWYGKKFHGQPTSIGERYDMYAMTAAHPTFPLPSYAKVTNPRNGKIVIVRVNDRGPFLNNRIIDLSYTAAAKLGYVNAGSTEVEVELIDQPDRPLVLAQVPTSTIVTATPPAGAGNVNKSQGSSEPHSEPSTTPTTTPSTTQATTPATPNLPAPSASQASTPEPALVLTRETIIANQPSAPAPGLYLQIGAFGTRDSAQATKLRLAQQFSWLGTEAANKTEIWLRPESGLFKLHLGPYVSRQEASTTIERLRNETGLQAFVVTR